MNQVDYRMDRTPPARRRPPLAPTAADRLSIWVVLFLVSLVFTLMVNFGQFRLSLYRILLTLWLVPCLVHWLSGRAGPIRLADICVVLIGLWGVVSWTAIDGPAAAVESGGIHVVESVGAYFLARCFVRGPETFRRMALVLFRIVLAMLPFLVYELLTGRSVILWLIGMIGSTYRDLGGQRLGLWRAQGPFQHPILLGVFCGTMVSLTFYVVAHGRSLLGRALLTLPVSFAAFCALSSGPISGIVFQYLMIGWDKGFARFRLRWWGLGAMLVLGYVAIDLLSNRTPLKVLFSYFALNDATAYARLQIFEWSWQDVMRHPVFGNGRGSLERLSSWQTTSIDMFWLERAVTHGLPMGALYLVAFFSLVITCARRRLSDPFLRDCRMGYLGSMVAFFGMGWAVHFWNETYVLLMFQMGAGVWLLDHHEPAAGVPFRPARPRPSPGGGSSPTSSG